MSTVGINKDVIREYIKNQEEADIIEDKGKRITPSGVAGKGAGETAPLGAASIMPL